jgi:hypothetical protein
MANISGDLAASGSHLGLPFLFGTFASADRVARLTVEVDVTARTAADNTSRSSRTNLIKETLHRHLVADHRIVETHFLPPKDQKA